MHLFDTWIKKEVGLDKKFLFITCGDWDLKTMLPSQCKIENIQVPHYCDMWHNIKKSYSLKTGVYVKGMMPMLTGLKLQHIGTHHRGLDDCKNIANILRALADRGCKFQPTNYNE
nr:ERI1 exoribonuclease 3-like [Penaeus vannamei]